MKTRKSGSEDLLISYFILFLMVILSGVIAFCAYQIADIVLFCVFS